MRELEITRWSLLVLAALSTTQTDAFARYEHHAHGAGDFAAQGVSRRDTSERDDSKSHAVLGYGTEGGHKSNIDAQRHDPAEPEVIRIDNERMGGVKIDQVQGFAHEDVVSIVHPESKIQKSEQQIIENAR
jgi:hypothetical protein